jgi:hypothetical protein
VAALTSSIYQDILAVYRRTIAYLEGKRKEPFKGESNCTSLNLLQITILEKI